MLWLNQKTEWRHRRHEQNHRSDIARLAWLARPNAPGPGHYFLLDTDAAWQPVDSIPEFDPPSDPGGL
jgi:hypothetical protein